MKTIASNNIVVNSPNLIARGFTIRQKNMAKIIKIVENDIYSDKILAVIREYSCNAYDANVEAGKEETPIVVSLPSKISPEFKVRDYGNGLTDDEIHEVYTSYGESTKENSDDYIGQLGIGSKSGFAYGDNFVVTSWKNGIKTVYNAVKGEDIRDMVKLYSEPSDEPSGIEVSIPVKTGDDTAFKNKSINLFKYWNVHPKLIGVSESDIANCKNIIIIDGGSWNLFKYTETHRYSEFYFKSIAVMGNISYPIDWNLVKEYLNKNADKISINNSIFKLVSSNNTMIRFKIGDLQISPSRESLQYTEHTIKSIVSKLEEISKELVEIIITNINSAKTIWEYKTKLNEMFGYLVGGGDAGYNNKGMMYSSLQNLDSIFELVKEKLFFGGKNIVNAFYDGFNDWDSEKGKLTNSSLNNTPPEFNTIVTSYELRRNDKLDVDVPNKNRYNFKIVSGSNNHLMIIDMTRKTHIKSCLKWYIKNNNVSRLYTLNFKNDVVKTAFFSNYDFTGATIVKLSDIFEKFKPLIPKRHSSSSKTLENDTVKCGVLNPTNHFEYYRRRTPNNLWEYNCEVNLKNETGYFLDVSNKNEIKVNNMVMNASQFLQMVHELHKKSVVNLLNINKIFGFGHKIINGKKFARNKKNWTNVVTHIETELKNINRNSFVAWKFLSKRISSDDMNQFYIHHNLLNRIVDKLPYTHSISEFFRGGYPEINGNIENQMNTISKFGLSFDTNQNDIELINKIETMFNFISTKYPMLKTLTKNRDYKNLSWNPSDEFVQEIVGYIKFIDNQTKLV